MDNNSGQKGKPLTSFSANESIDYDESCRIWESAFHMTGVALDRSGIGMRSGTGNRLLRSPTFQHHQVQSECGDIAVSGRGRGNKERPRGVEVSEESEHPSIRY